MNDALSADLLYKTCDSSQFDFKTTDEIGELEEIIGQARVLESIHFGVGIKREGYNLYVQGPSGVGKYEFVSQYLAQTAISGKVPDDVCYVNNFEQSQKPKALLLPCGCGHQLSSDMDELINDLHVAIPAAFETEKYSVQVQEIEDEFKEKNEQAFRALALEAEKHDVELLSTRTGFTLAPMKKGKILTSELYEKLPEGEKKQFEQVIAVLQEQLTNTVKNESVWQKEAQQEIKDLNREVVMSAVGHLLEALKHKHSDIPVVLEYLDAAEKDIIQNANEFRPQKNVLAEFAGVQEEEPPSSRRYRVNVLVSHQNEKGAPVIYEDEPMYQRLIGRVEHLTHMGALITDFLLIKAGALHQANGGYLIIDANKVLSHPYAWEGLKRALISGEIRIQSLGELFSLVSTVSLEPDPIPLNIKVILLGERLLYYLLSQYDPDFKELFKVSADFAVNIDRNEENKFLYAQLVATIANKQSLLALDREAVARVIEHGSRLTSDSEKLSTHLLSISDLLSEADYWAREAEHKYIQREDVQQAIDKQTYRVSRLRDEIYEEIGRGTLLIDTQGEKVGQINALSVVDLRGFSFGQPSRITATVRLGEGEVVDIEREVELGGAIHSKGVLILSSYIAARFAANIPLSLKASLVFEQTYGVVDGDSASVAELCVLMSVLAEVPIRQGIAVTGSVNQHGMVQAIGGSNEKVEGFYDICKMKGLDGTQGVLIPESNVKHLMLRSDVIDSVRNGEFSIYAIETVDQAIELLTGHEAGQADDDGNYPEGTVNYKVSKRLAELAEMRHAFSHPSHEDK